jgi:hypothetical protein
VTDAKYNEAYPGSLSNILKRRAMSIRTDEKKHCHREPDRKENYIDDRELHAKFHCSNTIAHPLIPRGKGVRNSSQKPSIPPILSSHAPIAMSPSTKATSMISGMA